LEFVGMFHSARRVLVPPQSPDMTRSWPAAGAARAAAGVATTVVADSSEQHSHLKRDNERS